jgi:Heterokaryon incompatibility protein (HET)
MRDRRINLVRVRKRPDGALCIDRKSNATTADDYIAISHVWGNPSTIEKVHVEGAGDVELSPGKRDILSILRRDDVCGKDWFWMDLFCIDQTASESHISISEQLQTIPQIYKSSRVTRILIESPICREWPRTATRARLSPYFDVEVFSEEEGRHSRKCPNLMFFDPWFERLWTRQEGLYGMHLDIVVLNWVDCARHTAHMSDMTRWQAEGEATLRQQYASEFIRDKLSYHGIDRANAFACYFELMYNLDLEISEYDGKVGPSEEYLPITAAWRSARRTTKKRDYVLAIMPDVEGYQVPNDARKHSFETLLADAFEQFRSNNLAIISKVPKGMMDNGNGPWISSIPSNITEAYDTFLAMPNVKDHDVVGRRVQLVERCKRSQKLDFGQDNFEQLLKLWESTGSFEYQISGLPLNGPCVGYSRDFRSVEALLHREFGHAFTKPVASQRADLRAHGVVNLTAMEVPDDVFSRALELFLICFICGTTLATARQVYEQAEFRLFPSRFGKLIGLVKKDALLGEDNLGFVTTGWSLSQGLQIAVITGNRCCIVGKTQVPKGIEEDNAVRSGEGEFLMLEGM